MGMGALHGGGDEGQLWSVLLASGIDQFSPASVSRIARNLDERVHVVFLLPTTSKGDFFRGSLAVG
jgi:hypothetical protein